MTPEEADRYEKNSPAALQQQQIQAQKEAQADKFKQDQILEDQKQLGKAGAEVLRSATEHSLNMEAVGEPSSNPQSFGSTTTL